MALGDSLRKLRRPITLGVEVAAPREQDSSHGKPFVNCV
jgi:hypothetical protein